MSLGLERPGRAVFGLAELGWVWLGH
jgi:hypothetical protein